MEDYNKPSINDRLSALLRSNHRHVRYVQALVILAVVVAFAVPLSMRQSGIAMATTETRLNCQYAGSGAHTHNADCYDDQGNLVCPLAEKPFHTHTAECYATELVLACGQDETEGHAHTDDCYETRTTDQLICELEGTTEEHVHGPACFETVTVNTPDDEAVAPEEDAFPEQELSGTLKDRDENGNERVVLAVQVKAPQGALPKGSTMRVDHVDLSERDAAGRTSQDKLDESLRKEAGENAAFVQTDAVDITFYDAQGNRVDPAKKVEVRITTDMIRSFSDQRTAGDDSVADDSVMVFHVVDGQRTKRVDAPDAEVIREVFLANQDEGDRSTGHEDTVLFEANEFSPYVVTRVDNAHLASLDDESISSEQVAEVDGDQAPEDQAEVTLSEKPAQSFSHQFADASGQPLLAVNVLAPEGAFPPGTTMKATWVDASHVEEAVSIAVSECTNGKLRDMRAVDITFIDADGHEIEPAEKITVAFSSDLIDTEDDSFVVHIDDEGSAEVMDALGEKELQQREMTNEANELVIESDAFSTYVVAVTTLHEEITASDGENYSITVSYGPEAGIPNGTELKVIEYSNVDPLFNECFSDREKWVESLANNGGSSDQGESSSENNDGLTIEPGFVDAVDSGVDASLSEEDTDRAASLLQSSSSPAISGYLLFDISLVHNGTEIEPLAPVQVTIQSTNPEMQEYDDISVGHYIESATNASQGLQMETIDDVSYNSDDSKEDLQLTVAFETTSFSLYDVAGIQWTANQSKTSYYALKTGINKVLSEDDNGAIDVRYSDIADMEPSAVAAYIQSLPAYDSAEPIIIYDKSGTDFYAIDGNGNLSQVYESGDMVLWNNQPTIGWKLIRCTNDSGDYTGYYDFINMDTGKFLAPQANQTISDNRIGVQLDGAAGHNTTIKAWDSSVNAYCGFSIQGGQLVTSDSADWFFASVSQTESDGLKLQTVETVDSTALGVTIKMFNYPNTCSKNNRSDYQTNYKIYDKNGKDWLGNGPVIQGLVQNKLNSNGYPVTTYQNTSREGLFTGSGSVTATNANHLFIQQTYDETGYFEYSSFENYAHLESNGDFTVYRQIGTEDIAKTPGDKTYGNRRYSSDDYFFNRGNFLPYNSIADNKTAAQKYGTNGNINQYDEDGDRLSSQDPRNGEALFLTQENVDSFFGMSMEAKFYKPPDGKYNGEDVIYEFNGDDDLWVFIDNVLVLDIGGCHNAHSGTINFSTGAVQVETGNGFANTTIKQCFKDANIFPDGTPWVESKVDQYFRGDTFADYSQHNMKMFYMERGAGASNLHMKFNLPVIKNPGQLIVDKVVSGTVNQKYSNEKFPFQVIKVDGSTETRFTSAKYESTGEAVEYQQSADIDGVTYNDVFYLRPGEAAVFDVVDNTQQYYVKELGINDDYYDRVLINREEATVTGGIAQSSVSSVKNRNRVTYDNHGVTEDLRIKKVVEGDVKNPNDLFEFYIYLTGQNNELIPYSNGAYYVLDPNGYYCTYVDGLPVGDSTITKETRTAYYSGQWGTIGSIPDGYTVLIPDLLVGTDFMVSERVDNIPAGYELKSIAVDDGTADEVTITSYANVTAGEEDSITVGSSTFTNHCEGELKKDAQTDAAVTVKNQAASKLTVNKVWTPNTYVTTHGPVKFALYKLVGGSEVLVENSFKTLTAPETSIEYQIVGSLEDYVVREVTVTTNGGETTVTPVANNGVIEVSGETTLLGSDMTDSYIVTYQQGAASGSTRTDTVTNTMPQLTVNKQDVDGHQLANAEFKLTGVDGETALTGYESFKSNDSESGNLLDGIYLSNGTYYLVETKAPAGFNMLNYKVKIVVSGSNGSNKIITASTDPESMASLTDRTPNNSLLYTFNVVNNPGAELPEAGGPGTALHTLCGLALFVAAGYIGFASRRKARKEVA